MNTQEAIKTFCWREKFDTPPEKTISFLKSYVRKMFDRIRYEISDENEFDKILSFAALYELANMDKDDSVRNEPQDERNERLKNAETLGVVGKKFLFPKGLFIYGPCGTGKTTAARILEKLFGFVFADVEFIARKYMVEKGEEWVSDFICENERKVVVIDDIGSEREMKRYGNSSPMVDIIFARSRSYEWYGVPTIYTSNHEELDKVYGKRIDSRIFGTCEGVLIAGNDRRIRCF